MTQRAAVMDAAACNRPVVGGQSGAMGPMPRSERPEQAKRCEAGRASRREAERRMSGALARRVGACEARNERSNATVPPCDATVSCGRMPRKTGEAMEGGAPLLEGGSDRSERQRSTLGVVDHQPGPRHRRSGDVPTACATSKGYESKGVVTHQRLV